MGLWRAKIRSLLLCLAGTGFNDVAFFAEKEFEPESSGRSQKTALHAESWQRRYRGAYLDSFLDGDVLADRLAVWHARLMAPSAAHFTIGAFQSDAVVGFVHMILDEDPHWGTLLDNLHVTYGLKRHGIARRLLTKAARELVQRCRADSRFYLWVLAQNTVTQAFYAVAPGSKPRSADRSPVGESSATVWPGRMLRCSCLHFRAVSRSWVVLRIRLSKRIGQPLARQFDKSLDSSCPGRGGQFGDPIDREAGPEGWSPGSCECWMVLEYEGAQRLFREAVR